MQTEFSGRLRVDRRKALLYGKPRQKKSYLTIGIPTVRRQGVDYLERTLHSLIIHSTPSQQTSMVVIIFMVDRDQAWVQKRSKQLAGKYPRYIDSGFLQIVHPHDQSIYPDFSKLKRTYNDSAKRVEWRSKQNIDYAYLFAYSENISKYYLHIEDDVIAASNYYVETVNFIEYKSRTFWYYMELSHIGFIGKLLRSSDLRDLSDYMMLFFAEQPCDLLLLALGHIKTQTKRIRITRSLFQHIGTVSSLQGKEQKVIDRFFKDSLTLQKSNYQKRYNHINPSANISTDIEVYTIHKPVYAYDLTDKYFWGVSPRKGSYFRVVFDAPQNISHVYVHTGTENKEPDILNHADLVVSTTNGRPCQNTTRITSFRSGDVDTKNSNITFPANIDCLTIEITANHTGWVIIREIAVFLPGEMETKDPKYDETPTNGQNVAKKRQPSYISKEQVNTLQPFSHSGKQNIHQDSDENKLQIRRKSDVQIRSYGRVDVNASNSSNGSHHLNIRRQDQISSGTNREPVYPVQYPVKYIGKSTNQDFRGIQICAPKQFHHANPPAAIYTQIESYSDYKAVHAYDTSTESYFWGPPRAGDYFLIMLDNSQNLSRIFIDTGCYGKESDIFYDARLLVSLRPSAQNERVSPKCQKLEDVGTFQNGDIDIKFPKNYTNIDCIVIEVTTDQSNWVIIREITLFLSEVSATTKKGEVHPNNTRFKSAMFKENILSVADTYKSLSKTSIRSVNITDQVILPSQWQRYITTSYPRQPRESFNKPHNIHVINKDRSSNKNRGERNVSMITHYGSKPTMLTGTKNAEIENFPKTASKRVKHGDNKVLGATYGGNNSLNTAPSSAGSDTWFEHPENVNKTIQRILAIRRFNKTSEHLNKPQNENELNYNVKLNTKLKGTGIISKKMFHHENPAATLYTSIRTFSKYVPKYAYDQ
ncbi:uncharacterized protein [Argopecten irradians]|uniref:uncharacterized protein n=1 Tax=Argopecten irradians TaxID=31199 RepID=UPI00370FFBEB